MHAAHCSVVVTLHDDPCITVMCELHDQPQTCFTLVMYLYHPFYFSMALLLLMHLANVITFHTDYNVTF